MTTHVWWFSVPKYTFSDPETGEAVPPELAERVPDYHVGNDNAPVYVTPRLCGRLFREFQAIDDVIRISEEREEQYEIEIDESIKMEGYENYLTCAEKELANYNGQLRVSVGTVSNKRKSVCSLSWKLMVFNRKEKLCPGVFLR